jgi:2-polyprenyl-3-methyl-5-hydroxy-6-metoxy-1,4-benzoquinol methylase
MNLFPLQKRDADLTEFMDDPNCDPAQLHRTYQQFATVNQIFAGWQGLYHKRLRPEFAQGAKTVLDIGCGGGDVLRLLAQWAGRDGFSVQFHGIDPDSRAIDFACQHTLAENITVAVATAESLTGQYDIVLSNHVLHHLTPEAIQALCHTTERLTARYAVHNDLCRSQWAYSLFPLTRLVFWNSFIVSDGLRSLRRAFTSPELQTVVPSGWQVSTAPPFRLRAEWRRE